jgi:hypothetical protein
MGRHDALFEIVGLSRARIVIRDVGNHREVLTVMNDIEGVIARLTLQGLLPIGRRLLYWDSQGELTEAVLDGRGRFVDYAPADPALLATTE